WVEQRAVARGQVMLVLPAQRFDRVPAHAAALRAGEKAARLPRTNCGAANSCHSGSVSGRGTPVPEGPTGTTRLALTSRASYAAPSILSRSYGPHVGRIVLPRGRSRRGESLTGARPPEYRGPTCSTTPPRRPFQHDHPVRMPSAVVAGWRAGRPGAGPSGPIRRAERHGLGDEWARRGLHD